MQNRKAAGVIRIDPKWHKALKRMSADTGIKIQDYATQAIKQSLLKDFGPDLVKQWTSERDDLQRQALKRFYQEHDPDQKEQ